MKVLLIVPPLNMGIIEQQIRGCMPPLDLLYLAAYLLKHGHEAKILDLRVQRLSQHEIADNVQSFNPYLVGFSTYTANIEQVYDLAEMIKGHFPFVKIVLGGIHASYLSDTCMAQPFIDFVVRGEGEQTLLELVSSLEENSPIENVPGIVYKSQGNIMNTLPRPIISDLDLLPLPAYQLIDFSNYFLSITRAVSNAKVASILTMRGCPYACSFCSHHYGYGNKVRKRNVHKVLEELRYLYDTYHIREFQFDDATFTCDPLRAKEICFLIIEQGLKIVWNCNVRADHASDELFQLMAKAGCKRILLGVESGNQAMLDRMRKGVMLRQIEFAVALAKKHGMRVSCSFLIGTPGETRSTAMETYHFALRLDPDYAMFSCLIPSVGSEIFDAAVKNKIIDVNNVKGADFSTAYCEREPVVKMAHVTKSEFFFLTGNFMRGFYFRPQYIIKRIFGVRSFFEIGRIFWGLMLVLRHQIRTFISCLNTGRN